MTDMETAYTFTVEDNKVIFTKDKESIGTAKEELIEALVRFMGLEYDDAVFYVTYLNSLTYKEVLKQDSEDMKQDQPGFWDKPGNYKDLQKGFKAGEKVGSDKGYNN